MLTWKVVFKVTILVCIVWALSVFVDEAKVIGILKTVKTSYIPVIFAVSVGALVFQSLRFKFLFGGEVLGYLESLKLGFIGFSFNNFLPSNLGSDLYKVAVLKSKFDRGRELIYRTLFDRGLGFTSTLLLGIWFFLFSPQIDVDVFGLYVPVLSVVLTLLLVFISVLVYAYLSWLQGLSRRDILAAVMFSTLFSVFQSMKFYFISEALGASVSFDQWMGIIALVQLFGLMPISIGGIGVFEAGLVLVVGLMMIPPDMGLAIGVINRLAVFLLSGVGLLIWFGQRNV